MKVAGNAELVIRVPESRDACPECFDRINRVRRQTGLTSVGTAPVSKPRELTDLTG